MNNTMSASVLVGWAFFFLPVLFPRFIKDENIRIFFTTVCTSIAIGIFIGHYIGILYPDSSP